MMPLTMAKAGETVTVRKISGKDEVRQHLAELGFVVDSDVTVVSEIGGNLIVQVKDSRIALDKTMANRIMVEEKRPSRREQCGWTEARASGGATGPIDQPESKGSRTLGTGEA